ncbi:hypothetical protein PIB30_105924 [Stylosanthes scabra]|uniref:Uncharacterized protein n=1 Tax=Stylosanthes scabra TaxID=79078 RepID=A0ABU6WWZ0_9FABA|nr:hypothetical protein [Stylosanthes scabra]
MAQRTLEEIVADDRRIMYRLDNISHATHNVNTEESVPSSQQERRPVGRPVGSVVELDILAASDP